MNAFAGLVKRGRTYDIEDSRTTNRMHRTLAILAAADIKPTITHGARTYYDWAMAGSLSADRHLCSLNGSGYADCTIVWPEWVTDEMFDEAWRFADATMEAEGRYNRAAAFAGR